MARTLPLQESYFRAREFFNGGASFFSKLDPPWGEPPGGPYQLYPYVLIPNGTVPLSFNAKCLAIFNPNLTSSFHNCDHLCRILLGIPKNSINFRGLNANKKGAFTPPICEYQRKELNYMH